MNATQQKFRTIDDLQQQLIDIKLGLALSLRREEDVRRLQNEMEADACFQKEAAEHKERMRSHIYKLIDRELHKRGHRENFRHTLRKAVNTAAAAVLIGAVGFSTALATSSDVRVRVMKMIMTIEEKYTAISLLEDVKTSFDVPAQWVAGYYLTYIPQGYELVRVVGDEDNSGSMFQNAEGKMIRFSEGTESSTTNIDTENAAVRLATIKGNQVTVIEKEGTTAFVWVEHDRYYVLWAHGSEEFVKNIMYGMVRVA